MSVVAPPPSRIHPERARAHRDGPSSPSRGTLVVLLLLMAGTHVACDSGLEPPEVARTGVIVAEINYEGQWPAPDSLNDLRFVAMRFVPRDTSDLLELNRIAFSERLEYYVGSDTVPRKGRPFIAVPTTAGTGSEVMRRIATPMVGGLMSSTILTLVVIPVMYAVLDRRTR